jgi:hypothetical protein
MVPFGGVLAMASSFGGAILPVRISDYESAFMKKNINDGRLVVLRNKSDVSFSKDPDGQEQHIEQRVGILMEQVENKLRSETQRKVPKNYIWFGLIGMGILLTAAHVAMVIVEQGALLPWWCRSKWWMHMWYFMGKSPSTEAVP